MKFMSYPIDKQYKSVYLFLREHGFSENYAKNLRKTWGSILVNDKIVNMRCPLNKGDVLKINDSPNAKSSIMQCDLPLEIVFEDGFYLVVNKPSGLATMPTRSHYSLNLAGAVCRYMEKVPDFVFRAVNRLDKDTAGLVIIAKSSIAQKELKNVSKTYHALCEGKIEKDITIDKPIFTQQNSLGYNENKRIISPLGKPAITQVHPLKFLENKNATLISCNLIHGRTHQIRVHLSSINHPLLGDTLYGTPSATLNHTALVCKKISFLHPFSKKEIALEVDYPQDIKDFIK